MKSIIYIILIAISFYSCNNDWLEIRRNKKQAIPNSNRDFMALLDNISVMNSGTPWLFEISSDDILILEQNWHNYPYLPTRNGYIWKKDIYEGVHVTDWDNCYKRIYYANLVLDNLKGNQNSTTESEIRGIALFHRAWNYYILLQLFSKQYDKLTSQDDLGLPIRDEADINIKKQRNSVEEVYEFIIKDLLNSLNNISEHTQYPTRPIKSSVLALLSKIYLQKGDYKNALFYAQETLKLKNSLLDFASLNANDNYPIARFNDEVIFHSTAATLPSIGTVNLRVDTQLYNNYQDFDSRKYIYFKQHGGLGFKGSYDGSSAMFSGITVSEIFLISAECNARLGNVIQAKEDLKTLLLNRFRSDVNLDKYIDSAGDILSLILLERRKELVFRGIRWADLKRYNKDELTSINLYRNLGTETFTLKPNDPRYVLPIPEKVIWLGNIQQNIR